LSNNAAASLAAIRPRSICSNRFRQAGGLLWWVKARLDDFILEFLMNLGERNFT